MSAGARPWFVEAFGPDYPEVYPHRDLAAARAEVAGLARLGLAGRLLDLACGFGRHTLALAELGHDVVGLDLSPELLAHARALPGAERLRGRLLRGDARALPFRDAAFDGVLNLFSSFGYFGEGGDRQVAREIARVLRPGGRALLDLMNPARVRATLVPASRREHGELVLDERRELADGGRRVRKEVRVLRAGRLAGCWTEDVRMYEPAELEELLGSAGLVRRSLSGDFAGAPFGPDAPRLIVELERRPERADRAP